VSRIKAILDEAEISSRCTTCADLFEQDDSGGRHSHDASGDAHEASYEHELEWLLLSKATTQAYGSVLSTILEHTIQLEDDIWYWDDVLSTYRFAGLYSIQTSPIRLYNWSKDIYRDVRERGGQLANGWREFYRLVRVSGLKGLWELVANCVSVCRTLRRTEALRNYKEGSSVLWGQCGMRAERSELR